MERIRWGNVARLVFVLAVAALVVHGLPTLGGSAPRGPALGLPEEVVRPPRTPPRVQPPLPRIERDRPATLPRTRRDRPRRRRQPAPPSLPRATSTPPPLPPSAAPPAPAVGEFGP